MKKFIILLTAAMLACSCNDCVSSVFDDYFVCIKDEYNSATSVIEDTSDDLTMSYYITLVAPILDSDVTVTFDVIPGDGLKEGVDYVVAKNARSVSIARGVTRMPVRIVYYKNSVDPDKDNTITIKLTGVDKGGISLGYPGPKALFSTHTITKIQPL